METHIDANRATNIFVNKMIFGFVPALDKMCVLMIFAMLYLLNAAAKVNPPNSNMITEFHMVLKMN